MRQDKLTSRFQQGLADAQSLAVGRDHQYIEPLHVMAALLDQQGGSVRHLLDKAGTNVNVLRTQLAESAATKSLPAHGSKVFQYDIRPSPEHTSGIVVNFSQDLDPPAPLPIRLLCQEDAPF